MLVNSISSLGQAVGEAIRGVEGAFVDLGKIILENLGNILIMVGMAATPIGWGLVAAGAAIQLGGGLLKGLGGGSNGGNFNLDRVSGGEYKMRVEGKDLVTVLGRQNTANNMNT